MYTSINNINFNNIETIDNVTEFTLNNFTVSNSNLTITDLDREGFFFVKSDNFKIVFDFNCEPKGKVVIRLNNREVLNISGSLTDYVFEKTFENIDILKLSIQCYDATINIKHIQYNMFDPEKYTKYILFNDTGAYSMIAHTGELKRLSISLDNINQKDIFSIGGETLIVDGNNSTITVTEKDSYDAYGVFQIAYLDAMQKNTAIVHGNLKHRKVMLHESLVFNRRPFERVEVFSTENDSVNFYHIFSTDQQMTWKAWNGTEWIEVDIDSDTDLESKAMSKETVTSLTPAIIQQLGTIIALDYCVIAIYKSDELEGELSQVNLYFRP